jgi:hypothetical protein
MTPSVQMLKRKVRFKHGRYWHIWKATGDGVTAHGNCADDARARWQQKWELSVAERVAERMTYSPKESR